MPSGSLAGAAPRLRPPRRGVQAAESRADLFVAVSLLGLANGFFGPIAESVRLHGPADALLATFGVSAILWLAAPLALLGLRHDRRLATSRDRMAAALAAVGCLAPDPHVSWAVVSGLALYLCRTAKDPAARRAAMTLLAITVPALWGKLVFLLFDDWILQGDAALVSLVTGLPREGNALKLAGDGWGYMIIAGPCSAFANLSLVAPCWLALRQGASQPGPGRLGWAAAAALAVIALNIGRISLIGRFPDHYEQLHGPVGASVAAWLTAFAIMACCYMGARDEPARS